MTNADATKKTKQAQVTTPMFRLSFAQLFEARKVNETDPKAKFSLVMLFKDKAKPQYANDKEAVDLTEMKQLVRATVVEKFGPDVLKWPVKVLGVDAAGKQIIGSALRIPFRDGAEKAYDGYGPGITFCSASSLMKPGVVDHNLNDIIVPSDIYSGCYCRATLTAFYYKNKGNEGISFGLRNVQKIKDGEPFGGGVKAANDFDALPAPEGSPAEMGGIPAGATGQAAAAVTKPVDPLFG